MIGYVTLGSDDLDRSRAFYDALFGEIGATRLMQMESGFTLYGTGWGKPGVAVTRPYDGKPAVAGNGNMVSLVVDRREKVDRLHARALELGASDEGPPGVRGEEGERAFYGAYFRDPDGHKFCVFRMGPPD
ncbi:MAG TPA: VOC family protein [Allosphingosinicella sp.]|jgi:catechol 2,3-dioxygenase-like lactoylglutathione lyase family enzyme